MLDDNEFARVWKLVSLSTDGRAAALAEYERITGYKETNFNVLSDHRISHHGPPCPRCGKVLRTPVAYKCFECGVVLHEPNWTFILRVVDGGYFVIKGRGLVVCADAEAVEGRLAVGDVVEFRDADRVLFRTDVHGIEQFLGTPVHIRRVGLLLSPETPAEKVRPGQDVWLVSSPRWHLSDSR
jgi:hypothetical protein